jgi:hypothetical protein
MSCLVLGINKLPWIPLGTITKRALTGISTALCTALTRLTAAASLYPTLAIAMLRWGETDWVVTKLFGSSLLILIYYVL